ncbi:GNAT family N-acetyltransferase [Paenibacillus sp. FSL H8-0537]|uniref:GNAT family N-acetyltransferase n=1 Tax=Paenibacillus sp. FSL H8-0537 TaxID=2921399 RepID=UPI00310101F2
MEFKTFTDPVLFFEKVRGFLEVREAENNLILGIINNEISNKGNEKDSKALMAFVEGNCKPMLVMITRSKNQLVISGENTIDNNAIGVAIAGFISLNIFLSGVVGKPELSSEFAKEWGLQNNCSQLIIKNQYIYILDQVNEINLSPGILRNATEKDVLLISEWIKAFFLETGVTINGETALIKAQRAVEDQSLFLWENSTPVSMAKIVRNSKNGSVISYVYTPFKWRRKGYAIACVASLSQFVLDQGKFFCSLYADRDNTTSNQIYQKIGYKFLEESCSYQFK